MLDDDIAHHSFSFSATGLPNMARYSLKCSGRGALALGVRLDAGGGGWWGATLRFGQLGTEKLGLVSAVRVGLLHGRPVRADRHHVIGGR